MNNTSYPTPALYVIPRITGGSFVAHFEDTMGLILREEYKHIKWVIADIDKSKENGMMTQKQYVHFLCHHWIPMVHNFTGKWGKPMVINDVHVSLNNVEKNLGTTRTICPPFLNLHLQIIDNKEYWEEDVSSNK